MAVRENTCMAEVRTHYSWQQSKVLNTATETKFRGSHDFFNGFLLNARLLNVEIMGQVRYLNKKDFSVVNTTADKTSFTYLNICSDTTVNVKAKN